MLPNDPIMLMSVINTKLRDMYSNLEALCEDMDISQTEIKERLLAAGYEYDSGQNCFRPVK